MRQSDNQVSQFKSKKGWSRILAACRYSFQGLKFAWKFNMAWTLTPVPGRPTAFFDHTHNLALQLAVELGLPMATLVMALLLVLIVELLNSAIEAVVDRISLDEHPLSKSAKDLGSAAVFLAIAAAALTWGVIVVPLFIG